ncbi:MAG: hypothetical protein MJ133_09160 [Lachnospiraceae bacterium]|nr:hypothetical protein [Lachnospiraceae bacterium]
MEKDRKIDLLLKRELNIKGINVKVVDIVFATVIWILGIFLRYKLFPIQSGDYVGCLEIWMNKIREYGGWKSLKYEISNYTSPYMYLMCLVSGADNTLYALKWISVAFDYIAAIAMFMIVWQLTKNTRKSILGMSFLILSPTVFVDSAYWCQCDIIYCSFILWAIYFFLKDRSELCMLMVGISFAFKLQAVFILPFLVIMWLKKKTVRIVDFLFIPGIYVILQLPAAMFGRPIGDLMTIYFNQADTYPWCTLQYPNAYIFFDENYTAGHYFNELSGAGTFLAVIVLGVLAYYIYTSKVKMTHNFIITLALFSVAVTIYLLPHMHERYGFIIDLLAIIYVILRPKKFWILLGFTIVSICSYMPFLVGKDIISMPVLAIILLGLIGFTGYDLYSQIKEQESIQEASED